jgi:hypothetical protein
MQTGVSGILPSLFESITEEEEKDTVSVNCSINVLNEVLKDILLSRRLWAAISPDLNL